MIDDRSLERAARSFIEAGPTEAPDHAVEAALLTIQSTPQERDLRVPWRSIPMHGPARWLGAVAAVAAVAIGAFLMFGRSSQHVGSESPAPSPSVSAVRVPSLDGTFTSSLYGYTVRFPSAWYVAPATAVWKVDDYANSDRALSDILGVGENFDGTATLLAPGESFEQWYAKYDLHRSAGTCGEPARQEAATVDGASGLIDLHCATQYLETVVAKDRRVYVFTLWRPRSREFFASMLDSVRLGPGPGACGLITSSEAAGGLADPAGGANPTEVGGGAGTSCVFRTDAGNVMLNVSYARIGGRASFEQVKNKSGAQAVESVGADAVFDPGSSTLYVAKGDALVGIEVVVPLDTSAQRLAYATPLARLVAGRI